MTFLFICIGASNAKADNSARILAYFTVGNDEAPTTNVTLEQFKTHMQMIKSGDYNVIPLQDIVKARKQNGALPTNSVVITFDGSSKSIIESAAPILEQYQFPFTVFLAPKRVASNDPRYLNWHDVKVMRQSPLINFGLHTDNYEDLNSLDVNVIREDLNNATVRFRDEMHYKPAIFSIPFGMLSKKYQDIIDTYSFDLLMGQNSAVFDTLSDWKMLPRFVMTEDYADANRFEMILNALPLPATQITPVYSIIDSNQPAIGFSVSKDIKDDLNKLNCYAGSQGKPNIDILEHRIEIRLKEPINDDRFRVNCTLGVFDENNENSITYRWIGFLFKVL